MAAKREIDSALDQLLDRTGSVGSADLARATGTTRQAVHRHLKRWVAEGFLVREGLGKATRYRRPAEVLFDRTYPLTELQEDEVWHDVRAAIPLLASPSAKNADDVSGYAVTEIVNNAIEHSGSAEVEVRAQREGDRLRFTIEDAGVGAFESVRAGFGLEDAIAALQELTKGKVTTKPEGHTGEGLFFTSKAVAHFELTANGLTWIVDNERSDYAFLESTVTAGTKVELLIALDAERTLLEVFERFTSDLEFDTTLCVIKLFEHGVRFVSRSEAKRLLSGLDRFRRVVLDFRDVEGVGQGFVDEVFRVWAGAHPEVELEPLNMAPPVAFMVRRGRAT